MKRLKIVARFPRQPKPWLLFFGLCGLLWVIFQPMMVHADTYYGLFEVSDNEEILRKLRLYRDYLTQGNALWFCLRWAGFGLAVVLERGVTIFREANINIVNIGNFFDSFGMQGILDQFSGLSNFLLMMALLLLFLLIMFGKRVDVPQAAINLFLAGIISVSVATFTTQGLDLVTNVVNSVNNGDSKIVNIGQLQVGDSQPSMNIGQKVVIDNVSDLTVFAKNDWIDPEKIDPKSQLSSFQNMNVTEQIAQPDKFGAESLLSYKIEDIDGQEVAAKFEPDVGFGKRWLQDFIGNGYYRYHVNWLTIIVTLAALNVAYILSGIRMGRFMIELGFNQAFVQYLAWADFRTLQRTKQVLLNIIGILVTIVCIFAIFQIFTAFTNFIVEQQLKGVSYILAMVGAVWFVLDGPVMIQKILGVDAGIQSAAGAIGGMMGVKAGASMAAGAAGMGGAAASKVANGAAAVAGAGVGHAAGSTEAMAKGINERKQQKDSNGGASDGSDENIKGLNEQQGAGGESQGGQQGQDDQGSGGEAAQTPEQEMENYHDDMDAKVESEQGLETPNGMEVPEDAGGVNATKDTADESATTPKESPKDTVQGLNEQAASSSSGEEAAAEVEKDNTPSDDAATNGTTPAEAAPSQQQEEQRKRQYDGEGSYWNHHPQEQKQEKPLKGLKKLRDSMNKGYDWGYNKSQPKPKKEDTNEEK
ncbi:hypothetical protein EP56_01750 [Listeriaceae bacterium FSL A5-0209]|nr:hypothetical protein EP56_01750 [Listeriaceae bacterium FSL A5-0209]